MVKTNVAEMNPKTRKLIKQLIRESKPEPFVIDGKVVYFNPLKKLLEGDPYKTMDGVAVTQEMVKKYEQFLKTRFQHEQIAKANGVDMEEIDKEESKNGRK
jgi:hypothetical protein